MKSNTDSNDKFNQKEAKMHKVGNLSLKCDLNLLYNFSSYS